MRFFKGQKLSREIRNKMRLAKLGKPGNNLGKKNKPRSQEFKDRRSRDTLGDKNPNWKGGVTNPNIKIRNSVEYKLWREAVFRRDNWTCIWCGKRSCAGRKVVLNADHIKPFSLFPELRFSIDNGRTLCIDCHKTTESFGWKGRYKNKS